MNIDMKKPINLLVAALLILIASQLIFPRLGLAWIAFLLFAPVVEEFIKYTLTKFPAKQALFWWSFIFIGEAIEHAIRLYFIHHVEILQILEIRAYPLVFHVATMLLYWELRNRPKAVLLPSVFIGMIIHGMLNWWWIYS